MREGKNIPKILNFLDKNILELLNFQRQKHTQITKETNKKRHYICFLSFYFISLHHKPTIKTMDKRLFNAQIKATEVQGLLAHIAKNVNYKQDLEKVATRNIDVINATLSEVCQMLEKINQELINQ